MTGRQVILTNRSFTLEELNDFMELRWDKDEYNNFFIGRPTPMSVEEYILLPATERFMVIAYGREAKGFLNKDNKVILTVCDAPGALGERLFTSIPSHNAFFGIWKISHTLSSEKERKGPAEDALKKYADYMRKLLSEAGYLK